MIEPTITQNSALYLAQHQVPPPHIRFLERFGLASRRRRKERREQQSLSELFLWERLYASHR